MKQKHEEKSVCYGCIIKSSCVSCWSGYEGKTEGKKTLFKSTFKSCAQCKQLCVPKTAVLVCLVICRALLQVFVIFLKCLCDCDTLLPLPTSGGKRSGEQGQCFMVSQGPALTPWVQVSQCPLSWTRVTSSVAHFWPPFCIIRHIFPRTAGLGHLHSSFCLSCLAVHFSLSRWSWAISWWGYWHLEGQKCEIKPNKIVV